MNILKKIAGSAVTGCFIFGLVTILSFTQGNWPEGLLAVCCVLFILWDAEQERTIACLRQISETQKDTIERLKAQIK